MQQLNKSPSRASLVAALLAALCAPSAWAFDSGSTGADGALNPTVNTEIQLPESGILNYTTVNIPSGVTVKFKRNTTNTPVYILASGDVTIAGTIDIRGQNAKHSGTAGDGVLGDDGLPGEGGPGGYDGGRGGREDAAQRAAIVNGGAGLGPGGGPGGVTGAQGCSQPDEGYQPWIGIGGAYSENSYRGYATSCSSSNRVHATSYGSSLLQPLVGGSGGGGGRGGTYYPGTGGGGGGGAILVAATGTLSLTGTINASGGDGGIATGDGVGGGGGGGSGGAIRLVATNLAGNGKLYATEGCGYDGTTRRCGNDGEWHQRGGSPGRIRVEGEVHNFSYTTSPAQVIDNQTAAVFIPNAPTLRIDSVGGQAVPANPTGTADLTFPADTSSAPVQITFATTNVPDGNTVRLRVVPAYGATIEAISPGISAGAAAVSVTLPSGPSTLQATTTYTVVVAALGDEALSEKLSRMAQNERVEKIEVTVALAGAATAKLITASGRSIDLPYAELAAAGFNG